LSLDSRFMTLVGVTLAVLGWCVTAPLRAQTVDGNILGIIRDQQGAAIANADISARNLETGAVRQTTSEDNGNYRISSVPAGSYEVSSSASGFKTELRAGIIVTVGGDVSVDFALTVGAVGEKIEVTGNAPDVDVASSTLGGFVNQATIRELPLNGRDWLQLSLLQPGVLLNESQSQGDENQDQRGNGIAISISGGRTTNNAFLIDGVLVNDYANAGPGSALHVNLGVDAIREFSVLTNSYSAEYGGGSGGIINAITKSGTNGIHGSGFYFIRNSALDARNFFDLGNIPPFRRSQFGGSVGGPIKKNKTFFFTNYEGLRELQSLSSSVTTLSANAHNGILCSNAACTSTTQVAINPAVLPYLALYPLPNGTVNGNTGVFAYGAPTLGDENYVIGKIDHYFSPATVLSGSYTYDNAAVTTPDNFDLLLGSFPSRRQNVVVSLQNILSANLVNNLRVGVSRTYAASNVDVKSMNSELTDLSLGFLPNLTMGNIIIPGVSGVFGGLGSGIGANALTLFGFTTPQVNDGLYWTKGRHNIRIGSSFERIDYNLEKPQKPNGQWDFASIQTFLEGVPSQFAGDLPGTNANRGERMSVIAGYIQDDYRMFSNFTINLGVRYEMGTVITEVNGELANLRNLTDPTVTVGNPLYHNPTLKNFAPRVGFAWDPFKDGKTAIRGGFGMYDIIPQPYLFVATIERTTPFFLAGSLANPPASSFPNDIAPLLTASTLNAAAIEFNPPRSYVATWNMNIQRQLTKSLALTVGYVGSSGVHLAHPIADVNEVPPSLVTWNGTNLIFPVPAKGQKIQKINPNFGLISEENWDGHSSYDALQANLVQRPIRGLTYQLAYVWSKSIDNGSSTFTEGGESANSAAGSYAFDPQINRGVSDFNTPQHFVANFLYDIPVPSAVAAHRLANALIGGWQIGGIYTRQSGEPFTLKIGSDEADTGNTDAATITGAERPNYVNAPGCSPDAVTSNISSYIKTQCFAFPAPGVLGNLGRNTLRMPVFNDLDFSVFKNQNVWGEKLKAQFRVEIYNILNNVNMQATTLTIFDGSGNLNTNVGQLLGPTANTARQIQFGLKLLF
jgi:Carboxypeptidase regulatory-like domain/TonB-dependent Receptor Plug Domain